MVLGIRIYLCPLRGASDRAKVSLALEHDRDHPGDAVEFWHPKGHSRELRQNRELRQKQRKDKSELGEELQEKLHASYAHLAYKHETVQKHAKVKPLFRIKEEIISQIILNELSKFTLRINSGLLKTQFSYTP